MSQKIDTQVCEERDWGRDPRAALRAWGPGILLIVIGIVIVDILGWPLEAAGLLWTAGIFWLGLSCFGNARQCGRFHCAVLSLVYPLLGLVALALTFGLVGVPWNSLWTVLSLVTILAFIPEFFGLQYIGPVAYNRQGAER